MPTVKFDMGLDLISTNTGFNSVQGGSPSNDILPSIVDINQNVVPLTLDLLDSCETGFSSTRPELPSGAASWVLTNQGTNAAMTDGIRLGDSDLLRFRIKGTNAATANIKVYCSLFDTRGGLPQMETTVSVNGSTAIAIDSNMNFTDSADFNNVTADSNGDYVVRLENTGQFVATVNAILIDYNSSASNTPPTVNNDTATTTENNSVNINVLGNDTDPDGDSLSVTLASASNGTVVIEANNTLTFTPASGFTGNATVTYTVSDGTATTDGTVTVTVNASPSNQDPVKSSDVQDILVNVGDSSSLSMSSNFTDADGDSLTYSITPALPTGFSLNASTGVITWDGGQSVTPPKMYEVSASDGNGGTDATDRIVIGVAPAGVAWQTNAVVSKTGIYSESEFSAVAVNDIAYGYWHIGTGIFSASNGAAQSDGGGRLYVWFHDVSDTDLATTIHPDPIDVLVNKSVDTINIGPIPLTDVGGGSVVTSMSVVSAGSTMQRGANYQVTIQDAPITPTTSNTSLVSGNDSLACTLVEDLGNAQYRLTFAVGDLSKQVNTTGYNWTVRVENS